MHLLRARSWLFTPATRPDRFAKASAAGADVAILDLEDAVAPKDKAQARTTALDYLAGNPADGVRHALRINGLDTRAGISDLDALLGIQRCSRLSGAAQDGDGRPSSNPRPPADCGGQGHEAHRPDRERAWPRRGRGDRDRDAAARRPDAGRRRHGGRPRGGHCVGSRSPSHAAGSSRPVLWRA